MSSSQQPTCAVYVDGSFIDGKIGYGAAVIIGGELFHEISGAITDPALAEHRQVGGELYAVLETLAWLKSRDILSCMIYYDYAGVEMWPTGAWKANKELTRRYAREVRESGIRITWVKVKSHSGDKWNDHADLLAKKGATGNGGAVSAKTKTAAPSAAAVPQEEKQRIVLEVAESFAAFISDGVIEASSEGLMNGQYARVVIYEGLDRLGIADIYFTKQSGLKSDLRAFADMEKQRLVAKRWISYLESRGR